MYQLLIVDDEVIIRNGLKNSVDWAALGFSVTGVCSCGNDAIRFLQDNAADVVLTDIRMHDGTGLELAEWISQHRPDTQVVLLTGYSDYEAACRAIACGAVKYLLNKPLPMQDIKALFGKLASALDAHYARAEQQNEMKLLCLRQAMENLPSAGRIWGDMALVAVSFPAGNAAAEPPPEMQSARLARRYRGMAQRVGSSALYLYPCAPQDAGELLQMARSRFYASPGADIRSFSQAEPFAQWLSELSPPALAEGGGDPLALVDGYLAEHLAEKILLRDIAGRFHYSISYFSRIFKAWSGVGFSDYLLQYRIRRAQQLLCETDAPIAEVSAAVGFEDSRHFAHAFKKRAGVTPSTYRRLNAWRNEPCR